MNDAPEGFAPCRAGDVQVGWELWFRISERNQRTTVTAVTPSAAGVIITHSKGRAEMGVDEPLIGKAP